MCTLSFKWAGARILVTLLLLKRVTKSWVYTLGLSNKRSRQFHVLTPKTRNARSPTVLGRVIAIERAVAEEDPRCCQEDMPTNGCKSSAQQVRARSRKYVKVRMATSCIIIHVHTLRLWSNSATCPCRTSFIRSGIKILRSTVNDANCGTVSKLRSCLCDLRLHAYVQIWANAKMAYSLHRREQIIADSKPISGYKTLATLVWATSDFGFCCIQSQANRRHSVCNSLTEARRSLIHWRRSVVATQLCVIGIQEYTVCGQRSEIRHI